MTYQNKLAPWIGGNHGNSKHQKTKLKQIPMSQIQNTKPNQR